MKEIVLTKGQKTFVSDEDYEYLMQWRWYMHNSGYACRKVRYGPRKENKTRTIFMHRVIMDCGYITEDDIFIDHINGNKLDNRRENLRYATAAENVRNRVKAPNNTSGYKGVSYHRFTGKWQATIGANNKQFYLGLYSTPEEAHEAYKAAALELHGEFARVD